MGRMRAGRPRPKERSARALRPSLSPTVPLAIALWAAAGLSFASADACEKAVCLGFAAGGAVAAVILAVALAVFHRFAVARVCLLVMLGCALGAASGMCRAAVLADQSSRVLSMPAGTYRIEALADAKDGDFGPTCMVRLACEDGSGAAVSLRYPDEIGLMRYGTAFTASLRFSELPEASRSYYREKAVVAVATASAMKEAPAEGMRGTLASVRARALSLFDGYEGSGQAFLRAILLGDRSMLEDGGFYRDVKAVGLAHVVAVSGAHLSIVCALIGAALSLARVPRKAAVPLQVAFIAGYLVCTGMPVSGIRAAIMAAVALSSLYARRRSSGLNALAVCVCCVLAVSPEAALSASFSLSVLATGGIVVFGGLAKEWCMAVTRGRLIRASDALSLTASSGVLTVPLCGALFSQVPLASPLANLYAMPFFALFCGGGLAVVGACLAAGEACRWMLDALVVAAQAFCEGIGALADLPVASIPCDLSVASALGASALIAVLAWCAWPKPSLRMGMGALALACIASALAFASPPRGNEVIMLDVGQGDALVVRSEGSSVLIDTGNQDARLLAALARNGVYALDAVIVSHPDDDHCASLAALDGTVRVGAVCVAKDLLSCPCASCAELRDAARSVVGSENLVGLSVGDAVRVGAIELSVIWPDGFSDEGGNADSLSLYLRCDADGDGETDWTGLFCGDAEDAELDAMAAAGRLGHVDLYKVGHHGSAAAIDEKTAALVSPEVSLVSVGENNRYGHPARETLAALEGAGSAVYRTDSAGDVVCRMTSEALEVSTLR